MPKETGKEVALTGGFSLSPANFEEAERFAKLMADSDLVPTAYKGKPGNVLVAVQMGAELGIKPLQAIQNIAVINGKPSIYGDLGIAILRAAGIRIDSDDIETVKKNKRARCKIIRANGETVERTFGEDDAKAAGLWGKQGPWTTYPWRQMAWRAFWFAARDGAADLLKGMAGAEEVADYPENSVIDVAVVDDGPKRASETAAGAVKAVEPRPEAGVIETKKEELKSEGNPILQGITIKVDAVTQKKEDGKTIYFILDAEGAKYWTESELIAKAASAAKKVGEATTLNYKPNPGFPSELIAVG